MSHDDLVRAIPRHNNLRMPVAPSAHQFYLVAYGGQDLQYWDYMNFAERYADFIVEFEKKNGDLRLCELWPTTHIGRMVDY